MRRSVPREPSSALPPHNSKYAMQYMCSRKTGERVPGFYWNPPDDCIGRISTYAGERWVDAVICLNCRMRRRGCIAADAIKFSKYTKPEDFHADRPRRRR